MKHYIVCSSPDRSKYVAVVFATGTSRPQDKLEEVEADLRKQGGEIGKVLFDLLATNGTKTRRYFSLQFDGSHFAPVRFHRVEPDEQVRKFSSEFFAAHLDQVDLSLLTPALRFAVKRGIAV